MTVRINHHVVLTDEEQDIAACAIDFFYRYFKGDIDQDEINQSCLAVSEYGLEAINDLATKIATSN